LKKETEYTEKVQEQKKKKKESYWRLSSHNCISGAHFFFNLWITKGNPFLKLDLQLGTEGSILLKIHAFLSIQMHQLIVIMISIAKGTLKVLLMCLVTRSGFNQVGT
jgi:hypothetical protein